MIVRNIICECFDYDTKRSGTFMLQSLVPVAVPDVLGLIPLYFLGSTVGFVRVGTDAAAFHFHQTLYIL